MILENDVNLFVYATMPGGTQIFVGRLLSRNLNSQTNKSGVFRYDPSYLKFQDAYPIDPVNLPLKPTVFQAPNGNTGVHSIFEDSLPDSWGLQILARKGGVEFGLCKPAHFLAILGGSGLGRLSFSESEKPARIIDCGIPYDNIEMALIEAANLETSVDTRTTSLQHLLACGSSAGGARPKILSHWQQEHWIAKMASMSDLTPKLNIALEEAGMKLAQQAGLNIPAIKRQTIGGREVLLVKRFDISKKGGRNALNSFKTLLGTSDPSSVSYHRLAEVVARHSHQPAVDLELLYRQMIVNVALVNGDDHLQNFAMLHTSRGWELSPAYDIVPNIYQSTQLIPINGKQAGIEKNDLIEEGLKFGLSKKKCDSLLEDVAESVSDWEDMFAECKVGSEHTQGLRENIRRSIQRIRT